jgi:tetratricopeptide (TPR) repeat protein
MKRLLLLLLALAIPCTDAHCETRYALVIGISGYPHFSDNKKLKYAGSDAQQFASFIETPDGGGFLPDNVHLLVNNQATRENIFNAFTWLRSHVGPDDILYVYFAGHGDKFGDNSYFLPYDTSPSQPDDRGIPMHDFYRKVTNDLQARQVIIFIDACHAAGADSARGTSSENGQDPWNTLNRKAGQVTMGFFSSLANEESYEDDTFKQGLFTHFLLEGLKGGSKATPEGYINAQSLYTYVENAVYAHSSSNFPDHQTPQRSQEFTATYILATIPKTALTSGDAIQHAEAGQKLGVAHKWNDAISEFKEAIRISPNWAEAHQALGTSLLAIADWEGGLAELKKAQSLQPDLPGLVETFSYAYYNWGLSFAKDKQYDTAIAQYQQAMHYRPDDPELYKAWGDALFNKKQSKETAQELIAKYTLASTLNPNSPGITGRLFLGHYYYGLMLAEAEQFDQAVIEFKAASEFDPKSEFFVKLHKVWGLSLLRTTKSDPDGAIEHFTNALSIEPDNPELHFDMGLALEVKGNKPAALEEYRKALAADPNNPEIRNNYNHLNSELATKPNSDPKR